MGDLGGEEDDEDEDNEMPDLEDVGEGEASTSFEGPEMKEVQVSVPPPPSPPPATTSAHKSPKQEPRSRD
ncbi:hypothetical protein JMJ35_000016 [Cladonia borealis]|uniref:Uncharacterized protein n=1 Tax=Cladonia borealis TaxID=184061 RepID=A0AA39RAT5_9LECA|nr:hypothetical protein JMJ35_000016 [Cladonia borealis]